MMPAVLSLPVVRAPVRRSRTGTVVRVVGVLLLLASVAGAMAWVTELSPFSLQRWPVVDPPDELALGPGTYIIYEEGPGQASATGPADLAVNVTTIAGKPVPTTPMIDGQGHAAATYATPWHEGRSIVSFTLANPTHLEILAFPPGFGLGPNANRPFGRRGSLDPSALADLPTVALAPEGSPGRLSGVLGLVLVSLVPALIGGGLLLVAQSVWPSPLRGAPGSRRHGRASAGGTPAPG
jgi:hypothetical protein